MGPHPVKAYQKVYSLFLLLLAFGPVAYGQLIVDFSMDRSGGCSPLLVRFTNHTSGVSSNAIYSWDFGNGNTSALFDGGAVYTAEQTYTITLTVKDRGSQSQITKQVTVYSPPSIADFNVSPVKICLGAPVTFSATAASGSGNIATYDWDFGDGSTTRGYGSSQPHTYGVEQVATVSLTVTNNYGCHTTLHKKDIVTIIQSLSSSFIADKKVLCLVTDAVQFTNNSTGPGTLDYLWDFADGNTSTQLSPNHIFNKKGNYAVSLKVHSSEGCTTTSTQVNPLNVANYSTDIGVPSPICKGSYVSFSGLSSPAPDNSVWELDGNPQYAYGNFSATFYTTGTHTVTLNNTFGNCPQTASKQFTVKDLPYPNGFTADLQGKCGAPVAVNFKDQTPGAVKWEWDFNYNNYSPQVTSIAQAPVYTYPSDGGYTAWLRVTNADGCSNTTSQYIQIVRPSVTINAGNGTLSSCTSLISYNFTTYSTEPLASTSWDFGDGGTSTDANPTHTFNNTAGKVYTATLHYTTQSGCTGTSTAYAYTQPGATPVSVYTQPYGAATCKTPLQVTFGTSSADPVASFKWDLGDGATSTDANPTHTYTGVGHYSAILNYTTQAGCKGIVYSNAVIVDDKINMDFSISPNPVCGNSTVYLSTTPNTYDVNLFSWDFGDGGYFTGLPNPTYTYNTAGDYKIKLYMKNIGGCDTTITKSITVKPPFPEVTGHSNTCDGTRGEVTFTQASVQATDIVWNFGDGATMTTPGTQTTVKHTYTKSGTYNVYLTASNGQCSLTANDRTPVYVLLKQAPKLTGDQTAICSNIPVNVQVSSLDRNPYQSDTYYYSYYYAGYYISRMEYRDGTPFLGTRTDPAYDYRWTTTYNGTLGNFKTGEKDLRFILTSYVFGCQDTTSYMPLAIKGASGGFEVTADKVCYQSPVILQDTSSSTPNNPILTWQWNFGDGQVATNTKGGTVKHTYANPGGYSVSLQITDAGGCSTTYPSTQYVTVNGPKAAFTPSGTDVHLNTTVYFNNYTNDYGNSNTTYQWDFGDGSTSTDAYPSHTYAVAGTYTVTMTARNPTLPCGSTATPVTIIVRNFNSNFSFNSSYLTGSCAPLLVSFTNTSYNYIRVTWDFGDGITADNINYASHIYEKPGKYIVTLHVFAYNGIEGKYIDSIVIKDPSVSLPPAPSETCVGKTVRLSSTPADAVSYSWDFGDGSIVPTASGSADHQYNTPGSYQATLLMQNDAGCVKDTVLQGLVKIRANPVGHFAPTDPWICRDASIPLQASGAGAGGTYRWSPAAGLSDASIADPIASPKVSTDYILKVTDDIGCQNTTPLTVTVVQPGNLKVSPDDTVCAGKTVQLLATGEEVYEWIDNTTGLSSTTIPNPTALAPSTTTYTVKGSDSHYCFIHEASSTITVRPLPTVDAGSDVLVQAGYDATLNATGSSDVTQLNWTPFIYLSCFNCTTPLCTPLASTRYIVTVRNEYGCKASDSVLVAVDCQESRVRVPNAFTPDGNGVNDVFIVKGISIIKHMVIYGRWGEKVYERSNFIAGERSSCWNGTYKGQRCLPGTYVYFIEMECPSGGTFSRKGSFVLIR